MSVGDTCTIHYNKHKLQYIITNGYDKSKRYYGKFG
jgi:hypothetical protein